MKWGSSYLVNRVRQKTGSHGVIKHPALTVIISGESAAKHFHLCPLSLCPGGHRLKDNREVQTVATRWLVTQDTDWYQQGMQKLASRYDMCLSCGRDCVVQ